MSESLRICRIDGVRLSPLREIADERGAVLHMLRVDAEDFTQFGECYLSEILPGAVKAWKRHRAQTQLFAVPAGRIRIVIYDPRTEAASHGCLQVLDLGRPDAYARLRIPPGLWYGFACLSPGPALIVNCADMIHDPRECDILAPNDAGIPYDWTTRKPT
jgi:dTDP-4-dehydrorhamnose 3,5-epimerase